MAERVNEDACPECGGPGVVFVRYNFGIVEQECGLCNGPDEDDLLAAWADYPEVGFH